MSLGPLAGMRAVPQWLVYALIPSKTRPGKTDKIPLHYLTGKPSGVNDPQTWTTAETAERTAAAWGVGFGAGFCFTEDCGYWFIDLDSCLLPSGEWSPLAVQTCQAFAGAAVEVSSSGNGLHLFGRGTVPPHACKNIAHHAELYHAGRFVAVSGNAVSGDCDTNHTAALAWFVGAYFPPRVGDGMPLADDGPRADWNGPADDAELLRRAMQSRSAGSVFGSRASFADLWHADTDALARAFPDPERAYDASSADAALGQHLAFWTGCDAARIERLMRESKLSREKYDRDDYLPRTITVACGQQIEVLADKKRPSASASAAPRYPLLPEDPYRTAQALIQRRFTHTDGPRLKAWHGGFYRWDGAAYCVMADADVRAELYDFLDREGESFYRPTQSRVSNLLDSLKAVTHLDSTLAAPCWITGNQPAPAAELVACANALLHLPTRALLPATPRLFNLNAVPFNYEPAAPQPVQWLKFLRDVWPNDHEAIATLQELFGYLLTPDTSQQKLFLIVGPKRSGKGTIARVLAEMLGVENVAGPTLASMATPFGLAPLVGKLAAVVSDARLSGRTDQQAVAENLLRISGEDRIDVERKFLPSVAMRLGVRFVLLSNELPRIADASGAMASRFVILTMSKSFIGREDPGLATKLLRELPGVLSWAVDGWHRLNARGHFVEPKSSAGAAQDLAELGSPINAFVREVCQCAPAAEVEASALFSAWRVWCATQGVERVAPSNLFGRDLRAAFPSITRGQSRVGGERVGNYRGIRLRAMGSVTGVTSTP